MAAVFIAIEGSSDIWVADLEGGTVSKIEDPSGKLAEINTLATGGITVIKGVKLAISVPSSDKVFSGHFEG
ncbi:hypothetical protein BJF93_08545 [Xaviernesmea oryzae]|uniref:Uncharacterized protein n=1 Tax=Xaviernesmea oryzae TaxID=464029 RepID=A0A1Q9B0W6_9HYPH|nr:hypothetical protein [Xaviernesmea oryzae]OLP61643.1 hypothetical protein BJF93_08545 [Xaviernesmea oryzae]SEL04873.1 hypothetical protein SAMN04487976_105215 [Xaviernesmea oryzae]